VIIPAAGEGQRFSKAGYNTPKPFLPLPNGKPMLQEIIDRAQLCNPSEIIVLGRYEHRNRGMLLTGCTWSSVYETTEGAADTVALAAPSIKDDDSVLVINSDNFVRTDLRLLPAFGAGRQGNAMLVFRASGPKWSYALLETEKISSGTSVVRVAEKVEISEWATAGFYYFAAWGEYLSAWARMRANDDRTNGEFYLAPVYNYLMSETSAFIIPADHFIGMGTPEEYEANKHLFGGV